MLKKYKPMQIRECYANDAKMYWDANLRITLMIRILTIRVIRKLAWRSVRSIRIIRKLASFLYEEYILRQCSYN